MLTLAGATRQPPVAADRPTPLWPISPDSLHSPGLLQIIVGADPAAPDPTMAIVPNLYQAMLAACRHEIAAEARAAWGLDRSDQTVFLLPDDVNAPPEFEVAIARHLREASFKVRSNNGGSPVSPELQQTPVSDPGSDRADSNPTRDTDRSSYGEMPNASEKAACTVENSGVDPLPDDASDVQSIDEPSGADWLSDSALSLQPLGEGPRRFAPLVTAEELAMLLDDSLP